MNNYIVVSTANPAVSYRASWEEVVARACYSIEHAKMLGVQFEGAEVVRLTDTEEVAAWALSKTGWTLAKIVAPRG